MKLNNVTRGLLAASFLGVTAFAYAQIAVPLRNPLSANDLVQIIPNGQPSAQSVYATVGVAAGVDSYSYQVPVTAFSITPPDGTSFLLLNPAGTLATGTLTMMANPSDGQKFSVFTSQTQTAITIAANTGQTLLSYCVTTPTALTAKTRYTWVYIGSKSGWCETA